MSFASTDIQWVWLFCEQITLEFITADLIDRDQRSPTSSKLAGMKYKKWKLFSNGTQRARSTMNSS